MNKVESPISIKDINMDPNSTGLGSSFLTLLTLVLIVLKLTGYISWSWWWVLLPLWLGPVIALVVLLGIGLIYFWRYKR
jgi:MFS superfamily sulfate permease-like transporter